MSKKTSRKTKSKIVSAAWKLFYEQGYEDTTVEEIIAESGTSKGSFYHYFEGKDALLSSLSYMFDEKYEELEPEIDEKQNRFDVLLYLNRELFRMIEDSIDFELLKRLYSTQLTTKGEKHLLDNNRLYYKLLRRYIQEGQKRGEINHSLQVADMVRYYALCERALLYEWCLRGGEMSLTEYAEKMFPLMLRGIRTDITEAR